MEQGDSIKKKKFKTSKNKSEKKQGQQKQKEPQDRPVSQQGPEHSGWGQRGPQDRPASQQGPEHSGWGQRGPQDRPASQQGPEQSGWGQRGPQDRPASQQGPEHSGWGQRGPQDRPASQQGPEHSGWGQRGPPDRPASQQGPEQSGWGQRGPPARPASQQGPEKSAWGQRGPRDRPASQQGPEKSGWGQRGPRDRPASQQGPEQSGWGQRGPQDRPASQQGSKKSAWGQRGPRDRPASQQASEKPQQETSKTHEPPSISKEVGKITQMVYESGIGSGQRFAMRICADKKSGRPITVASNFFRLIIADTNLIVYDYDVKMDPDKPKYLLREVWNKFAAKEFPGRLTAFNGTSNAYSNGPLMEEQSRTGSVVVFNKENNREKEFRVVITEVRRVSLKCFENYRERMKKDSSMKVLPEAETSILDIILRNWACENFVRSGRSFFSPSTKNPRSDELSNKLVLRNGYYQSAFLGYELYLNFELAHKAFYRAMPMVQLLECFRSNNYFNSAEMDSFIRGMKIEYQLPNDPSSRKIFSVNNLVKNANTQTFKKEDGRELTVAEYLLSEKNIRLQRPELPLLWVGSRQKTIYLPMEFCRVVPDQVYKGVIDPWETREMVRNATAEARKRMKYIYKLFDEVAINTQPLLKEFGLSVSTDMERVEGRVLEAPRLKTSGSIKVNEGTWRIREFLEPKELKNWCILKMDRRLPMQKIMDLQNLLKDRGQAFNMRIENPARSVMELEPQIKDMERIFKELGNMDLVIVIIPEMKGVYSKVKTLCETRGKILTQCVKSRTVQQDPRKLSTTIDNILLKVNAKLGGINHSLDKTSIPNCMKGKVMIVGADVTHPSPGMKIPSVAAVAVSCDEAAFKYSTTTRVQPKGEIIIDLEEIIAKHVAEFHRLRKCYPEKIIFFRDGVSEGELEKVFHAELGAVKKACRKFCEPKITFLVVQKRHHTRFYPLREADEVGKNFNVPPGTCIDTKIVHPRDLDFYLVSHASILGTARPTRYRLLYDDNNLTDDELERLSYCLCHLFSRCNRSVSYPSPTYNAHLAAFRVRAYLEECKGMFDIADIQKHIKDNISEKAPMYFV